MGLDEWSKVVGYRRGHFCARQAWRSCACSGMTMNHVELHPPYPIFKNDTRPTFSDSSLQ